MFIAGAISTGARVARYSELRKSSAMPLANLPMTLAVAGRDEQQRDVRRERDVLDVGVRAARVLVGDDGPAGDRLERDFADEPPGRPGHDRRDLVAALLQPARDLDGLVRADPAGHAERDQWHGVQLQLSRSADFSCSHEFTCFQLTRALVLAISSRASSTCLSRAAVSCRAAGVPAAPLRTECRQLNADNCAQLMLRFSCRKRRDDPFGRCPARIADARARRARWRASDRRSCRARR